MFHSNVFDAFADSNNATNLAQYVEIWAIKTQTVERCKPLTNSACGTSNTDVDISHRKLFQKNIKTTPIKNMSELRTIEEQRELISNIAKSCKNRCKNGFIACVAML
jgi:predicted transcriptional regulator